MSTEDLMESVREFQAAIKSSAVSYGQAVTEVRKVLRGVVPLNRKSTIHEIITGLADNALFMDYLYSRKRKPEGMERVTYKDVQDLLGTPLYDWKEDNDILDFPAWEDMSDDPDFVKGLQAALLQWTPKNVTPPVDYSRAASETRKLLDLLRKLEMGQSHDELRDIAEARKYAFEVLKLVKGR